MPNSGRGTGGGARIRREKSSSSSVSVRFFLVIGPPAEKEEKEDLKSLLQLPYSNISNQVHFHLLFFLCCSTGRNSTLLHLGTVIASFSVLFSFLRSSSDYSFPFFSLFLACTSFMICGRYALTSEEKGKKKLGGSFAQSPALSLLGRRERKRERDGENGERGGT